MPLKGPTKSVLWLIPMSTLGISLYPTLHQQKEKY